LGLLMGLDIGSTSIKAVLYDHLGNFVSEGSCAIPLSYPDTEHETWCVWEPEKIWDCVVFSIRKAISQKESAQEVDALAVTGFGMDGIPIDRSGNALYPFISWHCMRTLKQYDAFGKMMDARSLFHETGKKAMYMDSIYRMMWMQEHFPEMMEKTYKWLLIEDYINFKLCGEIATDFSMGSTTSALKPDTHTWSDKILRKVGIPVRIFPQPMLSGKVLGKVLPGVSALTGLNKDVKVVLGGHDYVCAAFAAGVVDEHQIMDITGTWEMLIRGCRDLDLTPQLADLGYYIEGHVVRDAYCICVSNVSGDMAEWYRRNLAESEEQRAKEEGCSVWDILMRGAKQSPVGSRGCTFLPHFSGSNAPVTEMTSLGAFVGMHNLVTKVDMMHAVLEGLTYKMREMTETLTGKSPLPDRIIAMGGAVRNPLWMQMKADVTGIPIEVPDLHEATPLGAALLAGLGTGAYQNTDEAVLAVRRECVFYEPNTAAYTQYDDLYKNVYRLLQPALKTVNRNIHERFISGSG